MIYASPHHLGYTLIELMVVITITALLVSLGISAYNIAHNKQLGKNATEQIISLLTAAQKDAQIGKKDCVGKFLGEQITLTLNTNSFRSQNLCENGEVGTPQTTLIPGITWGATYTFIFNPLSLGIDLGGSSPLWLDFSTDNSTDYRLELTSAGTIRSLGEI